MINITQLIALLENHRAIRGDVPIQLEIHNPKEVVYTNIEHGIKLTRDVSAYNPELEVLTINGFATNTKMTIEQPIVP